MKFIHLEEDRFRTFAQHHPLKTYFQTPEIAKQRQKNGWTSQYVGVEDNHQLIAASLLLFHKREFGQVECYAPRGLLVDYNNKEVLCFFIDHLKQYLKKESCYLFRMDPYLIKQQRDIHGNIVEGGENHQSVIDVLQKLGFKKSEKEEQIQWMFVLDLDREVDDILANMRDFTRRWIKKSQTNHLILRDAQYEELPLVKNILEDTCERKHFDNRDLSFFQSMYQLFSPRNEIRFVLVDMKIKEFIDELSVKIEKEKELIVRMTQNGSKQEKIKQHEQQIEIWKTKQQDLKKKMEQYGETVSVSAGVFVTYGDEVIYLFGGNRADFMIYGAPHFLQWEMICYAKEKGFQRYNFYGISGNFDKKDEQYGVYDCKKGYTGYVEELIGSYELPLNWFYKVRKGLKKIKKK